MGAITWGDVIAGRAAAEELVPFGGEEAHKAFALAAGLQLLVDALAGPEHGAVVVASSIPTTTVNSARVSSRSNRSDRPNGVRLDERSVPRN